MTITGRDVQIAEDVQLMVDARLVHDYLVAVDVFPDDMPMWIESCAYGAPDQIVYPGTYTVYYVE